MTKLKTHRGAAKRIKYTGKGKILRRHASKSHLLSRKRKKRKRNLKKSETLVSAEVHRIKKLMPR
jgi:large subunit ribosomal protein L35